MKYTRQDHSNFLEEELHAQMKVFNQKLNTSATFLLQEKEELFVAQFLTFKEDGEMILKFSAKRGLPRKGEYLYCFTVPKVLRDFRNWGEKTYGDLIKEKSNYSEIVCVWHAPAKDKEGNIEKDYYIAGFRGVELDFSVNVSEAEKMILLLGPNKPPFEYISNLQKIVKNNYSENVSSILDQDFRNSNWLPSLLDNKNDISNFIISQLELADQLILIGPPGTGKTFQIAEICNRLCEQGKSVLVTSLTNRALIEVIEKPALKNLLNERKIFKTKVSTDEKKDFPLLQATKEIDPQPGNLVLSTFFIASSKAATLTNDPPFDYVIVDEASQALLAMFSAAKLLGKKNIWIGDTKQLPPVVAINDDKVSKKNYHFLVNGLKALSDTSSAPIFQLTETYRLPSRGSDYTGLFYNNSLKSRAKDIRLTFPEIPVDVNVFFHPNGGSTLIKTDLEVGSKKPLNALKIAKLLIAHLLTIKENLHISVLSNYIDTVKALQKSISGSIDNPKNLLIETVARIQGLTTDVTIFVIPNTGYNHSLDARLFNVATSRAKRHTIIIGDKNIMSSYPHLDESVKSYLQKLNDEYSFYYAIDKQLIERKTVETKENQVEQKPQSQAETGLKVVGKIDLSQFEKPRKEIKKDKENLYIIDTNVFIDYPEIISRIGSEHPVVLSAKVLDELDKLKVTLDSHGKSNVQKALKSINQNIDKRDVRMEIADLSLLPEDFNKKSPDNFILSVSLKFKTENPILLTSDNGLQVKAKGMGVTTITLKEFLKR